MVAHKNTRDIISKIWKEAFDRSAEDKVGDHEMFFKRGGSSIAALKLYMEISEQLAVEIDSTEFLGTLAEGNFDDLVRLAHAAVVAVSPKPRTMPTQTA